MNRLINKEFILASSSQSRYKILKNAGLRFKQIKPLFNEERDKHLVVSKISNPVKYTKLLSYKKAESISKNSKGSIVVGCDTVIYYENNIINKANNFDEAFLKLKKMSGKKHIIVSGMSILKNNKGLLSTYEKTEINMRKLSDKEIKLYLETNGKKILNSVGCYQIENLGPLIIRNIKGDFYNVMGFPLFKFLNFLLENK